MNGIESVKTNSQDESKFETKTTESGKYRFNLKAANGQIIGTSQNYESESGCKNRIESVMKNAPAVEIVEVED